MLGCTYWDRKVKCIVDGHPDVVFHVEDLADVLPVVLHVALVYQTQDFPPNLNDEQILTFWLKNASSHIGESKCSF